MVYPKLSYNSTIRGGGSISINHEVCASYNFFCCRHRYNVEIVCLSKGFIYWLYIYRIGSMLNILGLLYLISFQYA
ncbi:hypothetical protein E1A91_D08G038500v1 [Gossypium mustelinum]|uniref:Uncharacterized protein n=1 Tax=Gossypium mustelinum TaxID=34275 RepID=A0A5D2TR93_GOSMU|nr:hypothetical protein E1A91_D08G038500v1 [Gossypium mustelinum]